MAEVHEFLNARKWDKDRAVVLARRVGHPAVFDSRHRAAGSQWLEYNAASDPHLKPRAARLAEGGPQYSDGTLRKFAHAAHRAGWKGQQGCPAKTHGSGTQQRRPPGKDWELRAMPAHKPDGATKDQLNRVSIT